MQTERRSAPRQGLNSLVYLDLEPGNGGILRNLSEDGMQISVANRLVTSSEIRFTLRLQPRETISGIGRVAWLSPSGRSAGVHFLSLPDEARREIRQWLGVNADSSSSAETTEAQTVSAPEPPRTEAPPAVAPAQTPTSATAAPELAPPETQTETAEAEHPPSSPAETPQMESPAPAETPEGQTEESAVTPPEADAPPPLAPVEAAPMPEPALEAAGPVVSPPEPTDALELLEATVEATEMEDVPLAWQPAEIAPADPALDGAEPSSVLSLYGIDGREEFEFDNHPEQAPNEPEWQQIAAARYPQHWTADRYSFRSRPTLESERPDFRISDDRAGSSKARRARARARRLKAARKHPPILLSPIFVPAPPQYESLPPPDPDKIYYPTAAPAETPFTEQPPAASAQSSATAGVSSTSLPEPPAEESSLSPGALYLPNYRIDQTAPVESPRSSFWDFFRKPMPQFSDIFGRFEEFGWSLENDWHVWLSLILLLAGFLALAQNPPMIVLTVAFWFAGAVVISDRRRPRHGARHAHKTGHR